MQWMKKSATHLCAVIKGMLFIGFSVQIILGFFWMCRNFSGIQDFGEPDSALYGAFLGLAGERPDLIYLLQMAAASLAGYCFLRKGHQIFWGTAPSVENGKKALTLWKVFALLTFPFAMQCHLAILPCSFMSSLFLLLISLLCEVFFPDKTHTHENRNWKRNLGLLGLALVCVWAFVTLSGMTDVEEREGEAGRSFEAAMARRIAWPTIWIDHEKWPEDLLEFTEEMIWETSYYPSKMYDLQALIESRADDETAKEYYRQMAEIAWDHHASMVVRQIGWDVLGYAVTPIIFQLQLEGRGYDSCTGRNYEIMRGNAPVLTKYYVDYGCWWFGCALALGLLFTVLQLGVVRGINGKKLILPTGICCFVSGIWILLLTAQGAGVMDYKYTIAVNELWLIWTLLIVK